MVEEIETHRVAPLSFPTRLDGLTSRFTIQDRTENALGSDVKSESPSRI